MEKCFLSLLLPLFLILQFYPVLVLSKPYTFPDKYFINCASGSSLTQGSKKFVGDKYPNSFTVGTTKSVKDTNQSTIGSLYQTARFYRHRFSYKFDINSTDKGLHMVRLHFFPFMSNKANLAEALFNVSASNKSLVSNLSFQNNTSFPLIMDFLIPINSANFKIHFIPALETSFAFVNAIEVFRVPNLEDNRIHVTSTGSKGRFKGSPFQVLRIVTRVIVGGRFIKDPSAVASEWLADDDYILNGNSAKKCDYFENGKLKYDESKVNENFTMASENLVPEPIYRSCRKVTLKNGQASNSTNITWHFNVSKNARHLVRAHFCDIISTSVDTINFSLFIYRDYSQQISPTEYQSPVPFFYDFVVDSGDYDFISISVVPWEEELSFDPSAYLNGLEIMEFIKEPGLEISEPKGKHAIFIITASVVGSFVICGLLVLYFLCKTSFGTSTLCFRETSSRSANPPPVANLNLKLQMPFSEIVKATNNFEAKMLIGEGGFGKVYKGTLRNGLKVAVKRSESKHGQGLPEFQTEVMVLSKIRHRNLVSLIGYCDEGPEMILVYEFMEKGNLRDHLYKLRGNPERPSALSLLTWRQRLEICIGAAKGLDYLHTGSGGRIIHRDVKSTNILLDEQYVAKVADFGLSKSAMLDSDELSSGVKGSCGYLDPEYFNCHQFTEKTDVYSFGVVLLEMLCARPAIINSHKVQEINLAEWGLFWLKQGLVEKIIDPSVAGQININSLRKFSDIVEKCLEPTGANRPTMLEIYEDLKYTLQLQETAVHREPHDDSTIDSSLDLSLRTFQRLPSNNFLFEKDDVPMEKDDGSVTTVVFSQLGIDGGR